MNRVVRVLGVIVFAPVVVMLVLMPFVLIWMGVATLMGGFDPGAELSRADTLRFVAFVLIWLGVLFLWGLLSFVEDVRR